MAYSISFYNYYNTQINWIFKQFVHDELVDGKLMLDYLIFQAIYLLIYIVISFPCNPQNQRLFINYYIGT